MGRVVKSEEEFLREMAEWARSHKGQKGAVTVAAKPADTSIPEDPTTAIGRNDKTGSFFFYHVPYQGRTIKRIERPMTLSMNGRAAHWDQHQKWLSDPKKNPLEFTIANMELEYQLMRICYTIKQNSPKSKIADEYIQIFRIALLKPLLTADSFYFEKNKITLQNNGGIESPVEVFDSTNLTLDQVTLSKMREESKLEEVCSLDPFTDKLLKKYMGAGYESAGKVLSFIASRRRNKLRETEFFYPNVFPATYPGSLSISEDGNLILNYLKTKGRAFLVKET